MRKIIFCYLFDVTNRLFTLLLKIMIQFIKINLKNISLHHLKKTFFDGSIFEINKIFCLTKIQKVYCKKALLGSTYLNCTM